MVGPGVRMAEDRIQVPWSSGVVPVSQAAWARRVVVSPAMTPGCATVVVLWVRGAGPAAAAARPRLEPFVDQAGEWQW